MLLGLSICLLVAGSACTPATVTVRQFPSTPDAVRALRGGTVEAVYGDYPAMAYAARESVGTLEVVRRQFDTANFGIAIAQDATELQAAVTAALSAIIGDGSYDRIIGAWALRGGHLDAPEGAGSVPEASAVPQLADGTLTVGMEISFAPMGFNDEAGQLAGVDVEIARALGERLGVEVAFENTEFDSLFGALGSGTIDIAMSAITVTDERRGQVHFVEYLQSGSAILVQTGNPQSIEFPAQLCGRSVGVQEGTVQAETLGSFPCQ